MDEPSAGRPPSIRLFEQLYAAGIAAALIAGLLAWQEIHAPAIPAGPVPPALTTGLIVGVGLSVAVPLVLLWLVTRRRSGAARWVAVVLTALGAAAIAALLVRGRAVSPTGAFDMLRILFQGAGLAATFRPDARAWFETREPTR